MQRIQLFVKVVLDADNEDKPLRLANELSRHIQKLYGVRLAEVQNVSTEKLPDETL